MPLRPRVSLRAMLLVIPAFALAAWVVRGVDDARRAARRSQCSGNLAFIALALHNYHEAYGHFPPAYLVDASGRPAHSWRVLILPFMEQGPLFNAYNFEEPWDGPNNARLAPRMPNVYACPNRDDGRDGLWTSYVALVGPDTAFPGDRPVSLRDVRDGTADTLILGEADGLKIPWMAPRDLDVRSGLTISPAGLSSKDGAGAYGIFADASRRWLPQSTKPDVLRALTTIRGGEPVGREGPSR